MVRFKNRYLLVEVYSLDEESNSFIRALGTLTASTAATYIRASIESNFGIHASATTSQSLSIKYCNPTTRLLLIRTARSDLGMIWASLTFLSGLPGAENEVKCGWKVIRVSGILYWFYGGECVIGTIRSCQKAAIRHSYTRLKHLLNLFKPTEAGIFPFLFLCNLG